jgi:hypothetical protein
VWVADGRPTDDPSAGTAGYLSPDGSYLVTEADAALPVTRVADGRRVRLRLDRYAWFGGWLGDARVLALTRTRHEDHVDPTAPDRTRGRLVSCSLRDGSCTTLRRVRATRSLVLLGGASPGDL